MDENEELSEETHAGGASAQDFELARPWIRSGLAAFIYATGRNHVTQPGAYVEADFFIDQLKKDLGL